MKKIITHINKSTFLALAFFGIMTLVGISTAHAQNDTLNPLFSTTGPNVLGEGRIQWNNSVDYYYSMQHFDNYDYTLDNAFGLSTGFRFGIGNRAELTLDVAGAYATVESTWLDGLTRNSGNTRAAAGAKLLLTEGRGWLPQVAFFTSVGWRTDKYVFNNIWVSRVQPQIGLMFRNRVGRTWAFDYSIGYSWEASSGPGIDFTSQIKYSIGFRHLIFDRLMLGMEIGNDNSANRMAGGIEARFQATPDLQLSLQEGFAFGLTEGLHASAQSHFLFGLHWTLR